MPDDYIHLEDFEKFVRNRFKDIVEGEGLTVPRQIVGYALDEVFSDDAVLTNATHSDGEERCILSGMCEMEMGNDCKTRECYVARRR